MNRRFTCKLCGATLSRKYAAKHVDVHLRRWQRSKAEGLRKVFPLHHAPPPKGAA